MTPAGGAGQAPAEVRRDGTGERVVGGPPSVAGGAASVAGGAASVAGGAGGSSGAMVAAGATGAGEPVGAESGEERLLSIGAAAARAGVTERALRYYQELGLLVPCAHTKGGMRRYSEKDLERVARIRELQTLLGLNLDEIAGVLRNEDRTAQIRAAYHDKGTDAAERRRLLQESLGLARELRQTVEAKRAELDSFLADLDTRIDKIESLLAGRRPPT